MAYDMYGRWVADYAGQPAPNWGAQQPPMNQPRQPQPPQQAADGPVATYIIPIDCEGNEDRYQLQQEQPQVFMTRDDALIIIATRHGNAVEKVRYDRRSEQLQQPPLDPRYPTREEMAAYVDSRLGSARVAAHRAKSTPTAAPAEEAGV